MNQNDNKTLKKIIKTLKQVHDCLESTADSDIDCFEDDEEEMEGAPVQYSARKVMEVIDKLEKLLVETK